MDAKLDICIDLLVSASRHLTEVNALLGGEYYRMLRDPIGGHQRDESPQRFFPWHEGKTWNSLTIFLNDRGEEGRQYRVMHALLVAMDIPIWEFVFDGWEHRDNRRRFSTTEKAKEIDEKNTKKRKTAPALVS